MGCSFSGLSLMSKSCVDVLFVAPVFGDSHERGKLSWSLDCDIWMNENACSCAKCGFHNVPGLG